MHAIEAQLFKDGWEPGKPWRARLVNLRDGAVLHTTKAHKTRRSLEAAILDMANCERMMVTFDRRPDLDK